MRQGQLAHQGNTYISAAADRLGLRNKAHRIIITQELGYGRDDRHLNGEPICRDVRDDVERRAEWLGLSLVTERGADGAGPGCTDQTAAAAAGAGLVQARPGNDGS